MSNDQQTIFQFYQPFLHAFHYDNNGTITAINLQYNGFSNVSGLRIKAHLLVVADGLKLKGRRFADTANRIEKLSMTIVIQAI